MVSRPIKRRMIPSWAQPFVFDPFPDGGSLVVLLILQCVPLNWSYRVYANLITYSNKHSEFKDHILEREECELL